MNDDQIVFGYGSLAGEHLRCPVAQLRGWRRVWGVAMDNRADVPGYKSYRLRSDGARPAVFVAFLDIEPDPSAGVTGVCMPVSARDLEALDRRERNYDRVDVTDAIAPSPDRRVWAYRGSEEGRARLREGRAAGCAVISRDYLVGVLAAVARIAPGELAAVERSPKPGSTDPRGESPPPITAQRRSAAFEGVHPAGAPPIGPGPRRRQGFIHDYRWIQAKAAGLEVLDLDRVELPADPGRRDAG